ncbi:hypothetical protein YQE_04620, partial [Dendroctonus ponderosae]
MDRGDCRWDTLYKVRIRPVEITSKRKLPQNISNCQHYAYLEDQVETSVHKPSLVSDCTPSNAALELVFLPSLAVSPGNLPDINESDFFDKLGQELISTCCTDRMERAFKCLGGNLEEFLATLDGVHDVLKYQENSNDGNAASPLQGGSIDNVFERSQVLPQKPFPGNMIHGLLISSAVTEWELCNFPAIHHGIAFCYDPQPYEDHPESEAAFICNALDDSHLHLDFTTERPAVAYLLVGSLKAVAKILYFTDVEITMTRSSDDKRHF